MDRSPTEQRTPDKDSHGPALSGDKLVLLKARLNQLEAELESAQILATSQSKNLEGLLSISEAGQNLSTLEAIYESTLDTVLEITGLPSAIIRQCDVRTGGFVMMASRGMTPQIIEEVGLIPAEDGIDGVAAQTLWPVVMEDMHHDERNISPGALTAGYFSLICVPLIARRELIGTMDLLTTSPYRWSEDEIRWLAAVGRQVGCVIANIQLTERVRDLAIIEERARLSRELHDGMSQMVGAILLRTEEARACIEDGDLAAVGDEIVKLRLIAQDLYSSLRYEMIGLRNSDLLERGVVEVLQEQLARFQRQWGIEARLVSNACPNSACYFPQPMIVQILRIVQEALTNVRQHASATQVQVILDECDDWYHLCIKDNGRGFDYGKVAPERLGLRILHERSGSLGGRLNVFSRPGEGTRLEIEIPKHPSQRLAKGILHEHHLTG